MCFGGTKVKSQTVNQTQMPTWLHDNLADITTDARHLAQRDFVPYEGQRVAGMTDPQAIAINRLTGDLDYTPAQVQSGQLATTDLSPYMNPYIRDVVDASNTEIDRSTIKNQQAASGRAALSGAFGGDRAAIEQAELEGAGQRTKALTAAQLMQAGYTQAQGAAQADIGARYAADVQNQQAGIQGQQIQGGIAGALFGMGTTQQQTDQSFLDAGYDEFMRNTNDQYQKLAFQAGLVTPIAPAFQTQTSNYAGPGGGGGGAGAGLLGAGLGMLGLGFADGGYIDGEAEEVFDPAAAGLDWGTLEDLLRRDARQVAAAPPAGEVASAPPRMGHNGGPRLDFEDDYDRDALVMREQEERAGQSPAVREALAELRAQQNATLNASVGPAAPPEPIAGGDVAGRLRQQRGLGAPQPEDAGRLSGGIPSLTEALRVADGRPTPQAELTEPLVMEGPAGYSVAAAGVPRVPVGNDRIGRQTFLESGGRPGAYNARTGASGLRQFTPVALQDIGVYRPAEGENLRNGSWSGTFNIPGHPEVRTQRDFLGSVEAQNAVGRLHDQNLERYYGQLGLDRFVGENVGGLRLTRDDLLNALHFTGPQNALRWASSAGQFNPNDGNLTVTGYVSRLRGGPPEYSAQMRGGGGEGGSRGRVVEDEGGVMTLTGDGGGGGNGGGGRGRILYRDADGVAVREGDETPAGDGGPPRAGLGAPRGPMPVGARGGAGGAGADGAPPAPAEEGGIRGWLRGRIRALQDPDNPLPLWMITSGLASMASRNPSALGALGEGGLAGLNAVQNVRSQAAEAEGRRQNNDIRRISAEAALARARRDGSGRMLTPGEVRAAGMRDGTVAYQDANGRPHVVQAPREPSDRQEPETWTDERDETGRVIGQRSSRGAFQPRVPREQSRQLSEDEARAAGYRPGTIVQRDQNGVDRVLQAPPEQQTPRVSDSARTNLGEAGTSAAAFSTLRSNFQDGFAGFGSETLGNAALTIARATPGESPRADWWAQYQEQKNLVRNRLFGSALTATEKAEFDRANIHPGMSDVTVRRNLERQEYWARRAAYNLARSYLADGFRRESVEAAIGFPIPDRMPEIPRSMRSGDDARAEGDAGAGRPQAGGAGQPPARSEVTAPPAPDRQRANAALAQARTELGEGATNEAIVARAREIMAAR